MKTKRVSRHAPHDTGERAVAACRLPSDDDEADAAALDPAATVSPPRLGRVLPGTKRRVESQVDAARPSDHSPARAFTRRCLSAVARRARRASSPWLRIRGREPPLRRSPSEPMTAATMPATDEHRHVPARSAGLRVEATASAVAIADRRSCWILAHDLTGELLEIRARLEPEIVVEPAPRLLVDVERLRVSSAAIEREHELRDEALAVRVLGDELLQLADRLLVAAERELGVEAELVRAEPELLEPVGLGAARRTTARRRREPARATSRERRPSARRPPRARPSPRRAMRAPAARRSHERPGVASPSSSA